MKNLRHALDMISQISKDEIIRPEQLVQNQTIELQNTSAVASNLSDINKSQQKSQRMSNIDQKIKKHCDIQDDVTLSSNCSGDSIDSWKTYTNPVVLGNDCTGNTICRGDIVEVLTSSKNGTPFKRNDKAKVLISPGAHIMLSKVGNEEMMGYRSSKKLRITESNH